jgi:hypothetical protein
MRCRLNELGIEPNDEIVCKIEEKQGIQKDLRSKFLKLGKTMDEPKIPLNPKKRTWREFAEMHIFEATKCDIGLFKRQHFNSNQNSASSDEVSIKLAKVDSECI